MSERINRRDNLGARLWIVAGKSEWPKRHVRRARQIAQQIPLTDLIDGQHRHYHHYLWDDNCQICRRLEFPLDRIRGYVAK